MLGVEVGGGVQSGQSGGVIESGAVFGLRVGLVLRLVLVSGATVSLCCVGCRDGLCPGGGALRAVWGVVAAASEVISGSVSGLVKQCRLM